MGTGYTRNDSANNIADGNVINASDLDGEFDAVQAAFNGSTGHSHDGTTGEGPQIATGGLADNAVTTAKITDANVTTAKIADANVTTAKIANANVTLAKMAANSIDSDQYVDGSIDTAHIGNLQVTTAKIAADAIDGTKLADNAVDSEHYTDGSIDRVHLAADIVDGTKIADDSIDSEHYVDGSIDTAHIANDAVTGDKLANNIQIAGTLGVTGETTLTTHLNMGDNDIIKLGASADLQIYHDGAAGSSHITETGSDSLYVRAENLFLQNTGGATYLQAISGGETQLRYNNSPKLATTNTGISVTGNVAVSGNVDGRDVASDGSKLDGIESGATADQSASEILTLIKTVDGAGSGLDADTLDGVSSASFLRSDAADTKTSGDLSFADSVKANFGGSNDLQIYHDGIDSYIQDNGGGNLLIQGNGTAVVIEDTSGNNNVVAYANGVTTLSYAGSAKLATNSTGVDITGNINAVDNIYLANAINHEGDTNTYMQFHAADQWRVVTGGTERIEVTNSSVTINDSGASYDFRVESDTSTHMLFVDGSANRVGINDSTPSYTLDVAGDINFTGTLRENGTAFSGGGGLFKGENGEVGSSAGDIFRVHEQTLNTNVTIDSDENGLCAGPLTIATGVTLTVNGNLSIV